MLAEEYSFRGDIPGYLDCESDYDYDAGGSSDQELDEVRIEIERQKRLERSVKGIRGPTRTTSVALDGTVFRSAASTTSLLSIDEDCSKTPFLYTPPDSPTNVRTDSPLLKGLMSSRAACLSAGEDELMPPRFGHEFRRGSSVRIQVHPNTAGSCNGTPSERFISPHSTKPAKFPEADSPSYGPVGESALYNIGSGDEGDLSLLKTENEKLSARLKRKRQQIHELKDREKLLQGEVSRLKAIVTELRSQLEAANTEQENQKREIDRLNDLQKAQASKLEASELEVAERELWYEENAQNLQQELTDLKEEFQTKEAANKDLQERLDAERSTNEQLKRKVTQLELRCLDLSSKMAMQDSMD